MKPIRLFSAPLVINCMSPRITVFIPVYQAERYLAESIESMLGQSFADFEVLIIDDGSCDRSYEIAAHYATKDQRIRVLQNGENRGVSFTRNRGIQEAKGEFLALLDADDLSVPERLAKQLAFFDQNPDVIACGTQAAIIDADGHDTGQRIETPTNKEEIKVLLAFQNQFVNSSMMFRMTALRKTEGYYNGLSEDYHLAAQLNAYSNLSNLPDTLVHYRSHQGSLSKQQLSKMQEGERAVFSLIHRQLGIKPDAHWIDVHHRVLNTLYSVDEGSRPITVRDFEDLFIRLRDANRKALIYPLESFECLLFNLFYNKLRSSKSRTALWTLLTSDLYQQKWIRAVMLRKLFKQGLGITG